MVLAVSTYFLINFWQICIRGQRTRILHEEASEEEGQGCCCLSCGLSSYLYQNFLLKAIISQTESDDQFCPEIYFLGTGWVYGC